MSKILHRPVKMMLKIFPPEGDAYVKSFIGSNLEHCKQLAEEHLDQHTQPGTRVIHMTTHYMPVPTGVDA